MASIPTVDIVVRAALRIHAHVHSDRRANFGDGQRDQPLSDRMAAAANVRALAQIKPGGAFNGFSESGPDTLGKKRRLAPIVRPRRDQCSYSLRAERFTSIYLK